MSDMNDNDGHDVEDWEANSENVGPLRGKGRGILFNVELKAALASADVDCERWIKEGPVIANNLDATVERLSAIFQGCMNIVRNADLDPLYWKQGRAHVLQRIANCIDIIIECTRACSFRARDPAHPASFLGATVALREMMRAYDSCAELGKSCQPKFDEPVVEVVSSIHTGIPSIPERLLLFCDHLLGVHVDIPHMERTIDAFARDARHRPIVVQSGQQCCVCLTAFAAGDDACTLVRGCEDFCDGSCCECTHGVFHMTCLAGMFFTRPLEGDVRARSSNCPTCRAEYCLKDIERNRLHILPPTPTKKRELLDLEMVTPVAPMKRLRRRPLNNRT